MRNDRLLAVAQQSLIYAAIKSVNDVAPASLDSITSSWTQFEVLCGFGFKILGVQSAARAVANLKAAAA